MASIILINGDTHPQGATTEALDEMVRVFDEEGIKTSMIQIGN